MKGGDPSGRIEEEEETEICSNTPPPPFLLHISPEIHVTTHKLVVGCRISFDIIQGVCVSESDTCTRILCIIRLHWEYVAPSS